MSRQTSAPLHSLRLETQTRRAKSLADIFASGELSLEAPYQRGSVWNEDQQVALIYSFLTGLPVPGVILNNRALAGWAQDAEVTYAAIDGKQRILTLWRWFSGELAVPASWFPKSEYDQTQILASPDGQLIAYPALTLPVQRDQSFYFTLPVSEACVATLAEEANIFLLINGGGTPQQEVTLRRAREIAR